MEPRADWFTASGAQELRDTSTFNYQDYLRRSETCTSPQYEEDLRQIELDLPRTGESIRLFLLTQEEKETLQENDDLPQNAMQMFLPVLKNVLTAYSVRNPRVGYVQGHADVLCFLLGNVNARRSEEETFWVYASIIERVFPDDFFARTPKLHGFQVDSKLLHELVVKKLVPHFPFLAKIDLLLVSTLLSCKWFVSLWVGELPLPLLYEVWDMMLREDDGTILHLLVALHFFRLAVDEIQLHMEMDQWDSSYIYKIILGQCQNATEVTPQTLLHQARSLYRLRDESVEDMRATIRRLPQLRKAEFTVLAKQTHFSHLEMERLQDEFTFLRFQRKRCGRSKLRGLRQEELESILVREFNTWPVDMYERIYQLVKPDGYGNISFYNLIQFLSVASRGAPEEKAHLLFQIADQQNHDSLNQRDIEQLADLLCCLLTNKMVADVEEHHDSRRDCATEAAKSPLLRRHFRTKLLALVTLDGQLQYTQWLEFALTDSEISQLMVWETTKCGSDRMLRMKNRSLSFWGMTPIQPALSRAPSDSEQVLPAKHSTEAWEESAAMQNGGKLTNNYGADSAPFLRKSGLTTVDEGFTGRRQVSLLSRKLNKKFKECWAPVGVDSLPRNPFEEPLVEREVETPCQCTTS